jgi:hypothetical protein
MPDDVHGGILVPINHDLPSGNGSASKIPVGELSLRIAWLDG